MNIHPTKTEIKFENEQPIWQILMAAVRESLAKSSSIPTIDFDVDESLSIPVYNPVKEKAAYRAPNVQVNTGYNPFDASEYKRPEFDWSKLYNDFEADCAAALQTTVDELISPVDEVLESDAGAPTLFIDDNTSSLVADSTFSAVQYKNRYIVTTLKSGFAVVDQHRAHIRILFDQFLQQMQLKQGVSQQLLFPEIIELTANEYDLIVQLKDELSFVGFDLTHLGNTSFAINGIPASITDQNPVSLFQALLAKVLELNCSLQHEMNELLALSLAKAAAIQSGKSLSTEEMDYMLAALFSGSDPHLTPDGKIIMTLLSDEEIENRFK